MSEHPLGARFTKVCEEVTALERRLDDALCENVSLRHALDDVQRFALVHREEGSEMEHAPMIGAWIKRQDVLELAKRYADRGKNDEG